MKRMLTEVSLEFNEAAQDLSYKLSIFIFHILDDTFLIHVWLSWCEDWRVEFCHHPERQNEETHTI